MERAKDQSQASAPLESAKPREQFSARRHHLHGAGNMAAQRFLAPQAAITTAGEEQEASVEGSPPVTSAPTPSLPAAPPGEPLKPDVRVQMESRMGTPFSDVRIHTDPAAARSVRSANAKAVTAGPDIFFAPGRFQPESPQGRRLLAHELTHVVQQRRDGRLRVGRDPDDEEEAFHDRTHRILTEIARAALIYTLNVIGDHDTFIARLETVSPPELRDLPDQMRADVLQRIPAISGVSATVDGETFDYISALDFLARILGLPLEFRSGSTSHGIDMVSRIFAGNIASYLNVPATPDPALHGAIFTTDFLAGQLTLVVEMFGDPREVIGLELEGTLVHLLQLRKRFSDATDAAARAMLGQQIGVASRRALQLNDLYESLEGQGVDHTIALEDRLSGIADEVEDIRQAAETEGATLQALGGDVRLLNLQEIELETWFDPELAGAAVISQDQAFPETVDSATLQMVTGLADRVVTQAAELARLRQEVIPASPTYSLDEFIAVYRRWFVFFDPTARDLDPFNRQMTNVYRELYVAMGIAGVEGGIGRAMLTEIMRPYVPQLLGQPTPDFGPELRQAGLARRESVTGTASHPSYSFAESFDRTVPLTALGEQSSRQQLIQRRTAESMRAFLQASLLRATGTSPLESARRTGLIQPGENPSQYVDFRNSRLASTWDFLLSTAVMDENFEPYFVHRQKTMSPEVARYLLAGMQHRSTLSRPHLPGLGEVAVAQAGVEAGTGVASAAYLRGEQDPVNPQVQTAQRSIRAAARAAGVTPGSAANPAQGATSRLIADLERYLNAYFENRTEAAPRIAGALIIAEAEHRVSSQATQHLTGDALVQAIAMAMAITAINRMLANLGAVGGAVSRGIDAILRLSGVTTGAALVSVVSWLHDTSKAGTFLEARIAAFFAYGVADDLGQLIQMQLIRGVASGFSAVRTGTAPPRNLDDLATHLEPALRDPAAREAFVNSLDADIQARQLAGAGRNQSDPDLISLQTLAAHVRGVSLPDVPLASSISLRTDPNSPGAVRGRDIYHLSESASTRMIPNPRNRSERIPAPPDPRRLTGKVAELNGVELAGGAFQVGRGNRFEIVQGTTRIPVRIEVLNAGNPVWNPATGAHAGESGPARLILRRDAATGEWAATVQLHESIRSDDVRHIVQHELNEISDIASRNPRATGADIVRETQASMFATGSNATVATGHDRAAARELRGHYEDLQNEMALERRSPMRINDAQARVDRMLYSMGLHDPLTINADKLTVLREAGVDPAFVGEIGAGRAWTRRQAENFNRTINPADYAAGRLPEAQPILTTTGELTRAGHTTKHLASVGDLVRLGVPILNNPQAIFTGIYPGSGRRVDVYWRDESIVVTEAGQKDRIITAYGRINTREAPNPVPLSDFQGNPAYVQVR